MSDRDSANSQFFPPQLKPLQTRLIQSIFPVVAYFGYQLQIETSAADIAKLKNIADSRVVYLPNHSNLDDGIVIFLLSARLGQLFNYVVAYEAFNGWVGKLLQNSGAYSIRRGMGDRTSIVHTLKILQQPACKLVIFPEGGCSYQNDTVMPFRPGAIELAFKASSLIEKKTKDVPDLYLVPVSFKYCYINETSSAIAKSLTKLETALQITPSTQDFYQRLRDIGEKILIERETTYKMEPQNSDGDWNVRIANLKEYLVRQCECWLQLETNPALPIRERVYKIQAILDSCKIESGKISGEDKEKIKKITFSLLNFDAIYDGYVAEKPTPERFIDTLNRLEREVFYLDRPQPLGQRKVVIKIGEPINIKAYRQSYRVNKAKAVAELQGEIQQIVQNNLTIEN